MIHVEFSIEKNISRVNPEKIARTYYYYYYQIFNCYIIKAD